MRKTVSIFLGICLGLAAASVNAGTKEQQQFAECKSALAEFYGEEPKSRLNKVRRRSGSTVMSIRVKPAGGENLTVMCSKTKEGILSLADREGVALVQDNSEETVSKAH